MSVNLSSKTNPTTTGPKADGSRPPRAISTGQIPRSTGSQGEHDEARGAEKNEEEILNLGGYISTPVSMSPTDLGARGPTLTLEALEDLGGRDPRAASLASVVARSNGPSSSSVVRPTDKRRTRTKVDTYFKSGGVEKENLGRSMGATIWGRRGLHRYQDVGGLGSYTIG